jgi:hypothetical protein
MNEENQVLQDPPVKTAKVAEYFIDLYDKSGYVLEEDKAFKLASSQNLKDEIARQHKVLALPVPPQPDLDSIFTSFVNQPEVEKKNLLQNTISELESSSALEEVDSSSDSGRKALQVSLDEEPVGPEKLFFDSMNRIDMNVFSMKGDEASRILDSELGDYGFKFEPASLGNKIVITSPDGEAREFRMFTEAYRNMPGQTENVNKLAEFRLAEMKNFIKSKANSFVIDNFSAIVSKSTSDNLLDNLSRIVGKYDKEIQFDLNDALSRYKESYNVNDYLKNGILDRSMVADDLNKARAGVITKSQKFDVADYEKLDRAAERFNINKRNISSILGSVLSKTGAYSKININNPEDIQKLNQIGISPADIPVDAIKVNGRARSLNYLTSNILYDFEKVQDIRDGKITIEIGDPKSAGVLAPFVSMAKKTAETQKAFESKNAGKPVLRFIEETAELGSNTLQAIGISAVEVPSNLGYILYDSMRMMGLNESEAEGLTYGALGIAGFSGIRPTDIESLRNEYLPQWDGSYLDSSGFYEFISRGSQDLANSVITSSLFMIPGGQAIALGNVAVSSYAQDRVNFENLRRDVEQKRSSGYALTEEEMNVVNMSDAKARLISLGKAATETAVTAQFTGKFFSKYQKFSGVKQKIESNYGSISEFNRVYANAVRNDLIGKVSRLTGLSARAIATEVPEEEIIAFTNYTSDVVFGLKKFDPLEARNLAVETGISSIFTSTAMGKIASLSTNKRARRLAVDIVSRNLTLPQERNIVSEKLRTDAEIARTEDNLIADGKDPSTDINLTLLKQQSLNLSDRINTIQEEKRKIAEQMPGPEKVAFLEVMQQIEQVKKSAAEATDIGRQKAVLSEIDKLKEKGRKMLAKYPSELSYYFADQKTQDKFESLAIEQLSNEAEVKGEEFDLRSGDDVVLEKAAGLYNDYLKQSKEEEADSYYAFQSFGAVNLPDIKVEIDKDDQFKGIQDLMVLLEQNTNSDQTLDELVKGKRSLDELLNDAFRADDQVKEEADRLKGIIDSRKDGLVTEEEAKQAEKELEDLFKVRDDIEESFYEEYLAIKGEAAVDMINNELESEGNLEDGKDRIRNIYSRLKGIDVTNISQELSEKELKTIYQFKKDLENGKRPQLGRMEAMLDAIEATNQMFARSGGKINLKGLVDEDGTLTERGLGVVLEKLQNVYTKGIYKTGGFSTKDVLARTLFRDREVGAPFMDVMNEAFRSSAEAENKARKAKADHLRAYKKDGGGDPNSPENSYELSILSALRRENDVISPSGSNGEFVRQKKLIFAELERRKKLYESNPSDQVNEGLYKMYQQAVDKLDVANANTYADVAGKASLANKNAVDRITSIMPGKRAFDRINDFESYDAFQYAEGTYAPIFMSKGGEAFNDYFGKSDSDIEAIAGSLKDVTRPEDLTDGLQLNPEMFWDNTYNAYRGMEMDIMAKKNYETLDYIVNSPRFQSMFEGDSKQAIIDSFKGIKRKFEADIRRSESSLLDVQALNDPTSVKQWEKRFAKISNIAYGTLANVTLGKWSQRAGQYYTATIGASTYLTSNRAKTYLSKKIGQFSTFSATYMDGNRRKMAIGDGMKELIKYKDPKLGNIYMKSRTGLRNSVLANLAVDSNQKIPIGYYVSAMKLDPAKEKDIVIKLGSTATVDQFLDFASKSNEIALELWLGQADKLAANAVFESAYLQYKEENGEKFGDDLSAWWDGQNKNPDLAAIRYADEIVAKTMRQTGQTSEAEAYAADASILTKNAMRIFFPYSKFIMNAKGDIANNLSILLDPNIPQSQKQLAERVIAGRTAEIVGYNALKFTAAKVTFEGAMALLKLGIPGLDMEEEDIERQGGMARLISEDVLPIVSKEEFDPRKLNLSEATTWEEYNAILKAQAGFTEIDGVADEMKSYMRTFEDKFKVQGDYSILGPTIQDLIMTANPVPIPDVADDIIASVFNGIWGEDVAQEFISKDFEKTGSGIGAINFLSQRAGVASVALEQAFALQRAYRMATTFEREKFMEAGPNIIEHISAPTEPMREKLVGATQLLLLTRVLSLSLPLAPRADLDRFSDKLERAIENEFSTSKKDERMIEIRDGLLFPFEGFKDSNVPE